MFVPGAPQHVNRALIVYYCTDVYGMALMMVKHVHLHELCNVLGEKTKGNVKKSPLCSLQYLAAQ